MKRRLTEIFRRRLWPFLFAALPALSRAAETLVPGDAEIAAIADSASHLFWKLFFSVVILAAAFFIIKVLSWLVDAFSERGARYRFLKKFTPWIKTLTWAGAVYVIIDWVFNPSAQQLVGLLTASGVAIGLASQDILKNVFGGLVIIFDRPFQVGDKIRVGEHYGEVLGIGLRKVTIVTPEDSVVSIPNSEIANKSVSNANSGALECQVKIKIVLPIGIDIKEAVKIAWEAAMTSRYVSIKRPVVVMVDDHPSEWSYRTLLNIKAYVYDTRFEFHFSSDVTEVVKEEFSKRGFFDQKTPPKPIRASSHQTGPLFQPDLSSSPKTIPNPQ